MSETDAVSREQAEHILATVQTAGANAEILDQIERSCGDNDRAAEGIANLRQLVDAFAGAGFPEDRLAIDLSIARGLDYYTGTVYETLLGDLPAIGSVCSGGRYDDLAGLYTKQHLPGVGASLGLDRLMAAMEELGLLQDVPLHRRTSSSSSSPPKPYRPTLPSRAACGKPASALNCIQRPRAWVGSSNTPTARAFPSP